MTKTFEGNFNLQFNKTTELLELKPHPEGKYTAETAGECLASAMAFCDANPNAGFNRWDFYIPNVNQTIERDSKVLHADHVADAVKRGDTPTVRAGKWGKPKMTIAGPVTQVKKADDNIVTL